MKSINQFKMDHISLVLTFLGILEIAMILLLLFDIKRCGPETTAKTIITYIFIGLYQISLFISFFVFIIYQTVHMLFYCSSKIFTRNPTSMHDLFYVLVSNCITQIFVFV